MKVLITRPEPAAASTAAQLRRMGFEPILAPCLRIHRLPARLPANPAALLITSAQAIASLPERFHHLPAFCVGDATAARLRQAGFTAVESAAGNAGDLARLVVQRRLRGTHLLATGERQGLDLAAQLRGLGIKVARRKVYAARPLAALPATARSALAAGEITKALFYSAETVAAFIRLQPPGTANADALVLSPAIAAAAEGLPWRRIRVALAPNEADLLALLNE